jgi:serine/threonine-protein kinase ULK4
VVKSGIQPYSAAPELFTEGGLHSFASDLWALGCVLYECAAGKPPFVSSSLSELMEMILGEEPPPLDPLVGGASTTRIQLTRSTCESAWFLQPLGNYKVKTRFPKMLLFQIRLVYRYASVTPGTHQLSPAFVDVVFRLLDKDPARRLDWAGLTAHRFWVESGAGGVSASAGGVSGVSGGGVGGGGHGNGNGGLSGAELRALVEASPLPLQPAFDEFVRSAALADRFSAATSLSPGASPKSGADKTSGGGLGGGGSPSAAGVGAGAGAGGHAAAAAESKQSEKGVVPGVGGRDPRDSVRASGRVAVRRSSVHSQEVVRLSTIARNNLEREEGGAYTSGRGEGGGGSGGGGSSGGGGNSEGGRGGGGRGSNDSAAGGGSGANGRKASVRPSASAGHAAGDVELANPDAELNFADDAGGDAAEAGRPGSGGGGGAAVRPLSGGGDGDATVAMTPRGGAGGGGGRSGGGGGGESAAATAEEAALEEEIVADPGAASAAAAAAAEQTAAMEEDRRQQQQQQQQESDRPSSAGFASLGGRPPSAEPTPEEAAAAAIAASAHGQSSRQQQQQSLGPAAARPTTSHVPGGPTPPTREAAHPLPAATPPGVGLSRHSRAGGPWATTTDQSQSSTGGGGSGGKNNPAAVTTDGADLPAIDIAELMNHASDSQVKPIVLNRRIEVMTEPHYDPDALPFEPLTIADMLAAPQAELEGFLTQIYRSVAHSSPINEKVNTLAYFETLCCDTAAANVLINSSLMTLFVRMLRASKAPTLRIRLTSSMGLLLRHATYITEELAASGVVTVLTECLKDKNERVRRRAMATLGELLFYIATQQHEATEAAQRAGGAGATAANAAAAAWQVPASTVGTVTRMLRAGEDEIAQHYAVKTIENIVSHGGEWAAKFASAEVTAALVTIMTGAKLEQLRGTAASTLARAARSSPAVLQLVLDRYGIKLLVTGLRDPSPKVQQAALNLLNRGLGDLGARARAALAAEDKSLLLPTLVALLERGGAVQVESSLPTA